MGAAFAGVGMRFAMPFCFRALAGFGRARVTLGCAVMAAAGMLIAMGIELLGTPAAATVCLAMLAVAAGLFGVLRTSGLVAWASSVPERRGLVDVFLVPAVCAFVLSVVYGIIDAVALGAAPSPTVSIYVSPCGGIAAAVVFYLCFGRSAPVSSATLFNTVFGVLATGILALPFASPAYAMALNALVAAGWKLVMLALFYLVVVTYAAHPARLLNAIALAYALPRCGLFVGVSVARADQMAWDEECEVLVIGSGYAGLAAALTAKEAGADVKVIEKLAIEGGNSSVAAGDMAVCCSSVQEREGVQDSVDDYVNDMLVAGLYLNDKEKCRVIAEKSNETWEWTLTMGATWDVNDDGEHYLYPYGGHSVKRSIAQGVGGGRNVTAPFTQKLAEMGVPVETGRMLTQIVRDEDGRAVGVVVHDDPQGNDVSTGTPATIRATKGIVVATGGFGRDVEFRMAQDPRLDETVDCTNMAGATAESLKALVAAGAMAVQTDWIQLLPFMSPDEVGYGVAAFYTDGQASYAPTLDAATGRRVVNEMTDRKRYADAILATGQPCVQISCKKALYAGGSGLENAIEAGIVHEFASLEEAAEFYGMPVDAVVDEMARYNGFIESGVDEDFGKEFAEDAQPIDEPPFYGVRLWPKVHHCMGGVKTDVDCRMLDMDLQPIPGLFAAGEVAGGIHGACRLGSCATADCLVNGRIAGGMAAAE